MADNREAVGHGGLSVVRADVDGIAVLGLEGEVDYQSSSALTRVMPPADDDPGRRLVLDLSQVTFMDSSGVNALIAAHQARRPVQGWLRLAGVRGAVLRTLQLVGLDTMIACFPSVEDALRP
ncbi:MULTISPECIES: STAS domain-containing protein [Streptomyces]|uniref:Anti-sigma factor antagonist n=1 Tax=Streptomyces gilvifuscus TaxID=1550617 RepID=A0ABT5FNX3_9ACTN|nr:MULTISPECIES: STAS domain-containing protein [Streptomyces]MDC2954231.1 STAS domain-containing protein [Streptomyces gilvifuscus]